MIDTPVNNSTTSVEPYESFKEHGSHDLDALVLSTAAEKSGSNPSTFRSSFNDKMNQFATMLPEDTGVLESCQSIPKPSFGFCGAMQPFEANIEAMKSFLCMSKEDTTARDAEETREVTVSNDSEGRDTFLTKREDEGIKFGLSWNELKKEAEDRAIAALERVERAGMLSERSLDTVRAGREARRAEEKAKKTEAEAQALLTEAKAKEEMEAQAKVDEAQAKEADVQAAKTEMEVKTTAELELKIAAELEAQAKMTKAEAEKAKADLEAQAMADAVAKAKKDKADLTKEEIKAKKLAAAEAKAAAKAAEKERKKAKAKATAATKAAEAARKKAAKKLDKLIKAKKAACKAFGAENTPEKVQKEEPTSMVEKASDVKEELTKMIESASEEKVQEEEPTRDIGELVDLELQKQEQEEQEQKEELQKQEQEEQEQAQAQEEQEQAQAQAPEEQAQEEQEPEVEPDVESVAESVVESVVESVIEPGSGMARRQSFGSVLRMSERAMELELHEQEANDPVAAPEEQEANEPAAAPEEPVAEPGPGPDVARGSSFGSVLRMNKEAKSLVNGEKEVTTMVSMEEEMRRMNEQAAGLVTGIWKKNKATTD